MPATDTDLICAIATPPGEGGIGVIRLSGLRAKIVAQSIIKPSLKPRQAHYTAFVANEEVLDDGIALWFPGPNSFTGEDVVELQGHGGPIVQQTILQELCDRGARLARPGEFSERAFLNGKLDLVQAEAIADLIAAKSKAAAKAARSSFQGVFSQKILSLADQMLRMRIEIEAAIDFPDEDVEILQQAKVAQTLNTLISETDDLLKQAEQGRRLNQGLTIALIGEPNVGKSSLLNALAGEEAAIVTSVPGTTRDLLKIDVVIDGMPIRLVDTAGLRDSDDEVERIGIQRARQQIEQADCVALILSATTLLSIDDELSRQTYFSDALTQLTGADLDATYHGVQIVVNKVDLGIPVIPQQWQKRTSFVSATEGDGLSELVSNLLKEQTVDGEIAGFTARARHVQALTKTHSLLIQAQNSLNASVDVELIAEDCSLAHQMLGEIVGKLTPDDLLGEIFSTFCIGK